MKIYTKSGDKGETGLGDGSRVSKDDLRIQAYGTIDELNSVLGICVAVGPQEEVTQALQTIQKQLFSIGSVVANPKQSKQLNSGDDKSLKLKEKVILSEEAVTAMEKWIDTHEARLKPLRSFILPGGSLTGAHMHLARTVCRRAERELVHLAKQTDVPELFIIYLNRLSDLLFVLARSENHFKKIEDIPW